MLPLQLSYAYLAQLSLAVGALVFLAGLAVLHLVAIVWARLYFYRRLEPLDPEADRLPGVSILKPLVGIDKNVYANLETYFTLQYPRYELLFCLESSEDIVSMVVDTLMEKYPHVDARVFKSPKQHSVNPKVNNMMQGFECAKYDLLLISDSGVRMLPQALADMVRCMGRDVGMVHQMPFTEQRPGFHNVVQSAYFGGTHAKVYITANLVGINCTTGMSCLFRKSILDPLPGGLAYFGRYLAEDFFLSQYVRSRGFRVVLSHYPALQDGSTSVGNLRRRLIRWIKLRSAMIPHVVLLEPFSDCLLSGLMAAWALAFLWPSGVNVYAYFLIHCLAWLLCDYLLMLNCMESPAPFSRLAFVCAWLLCACMSPLNVLCAQCQRGVEWRGRRFRLEWGGVTRELPLEASVAAATTAAAAESADPASQKKVAI
ncbi:hypothetical protein BOX15_Mlig000241g1 [Macrostomum lignano]|uniref:ceramide glucosyltransferase n=1 Tax=Macrostomum lignano TaxID=282301 RepID=A0A267G5G8_9PLAT|nr:hypothetical protein BOX15_Mlig000241g1 [Macrostomum lignano]